MSKELYNKVSNELCPEGNWKLRNTVEKLIKLQMSRLPRTEVSEEEIRYPTGPAGMAAFLDTFFARHYFQVQDSLLDYMTSEEFGGVLDRQELNILDIGSGPAVASLAITDMLACIIEHMKSMGQWLNGQKAKIGYVLNDIENICLGVGQELLRNYFKLNSRQDSKLLHTRMLTIKKDFPLNMSHLRRICQNIGYYDIINFSYIANPLNEKYGLESMGNDFAQVKSMCNPTGRILILQDKFNASLLRKIAKVVSQSCQKRVLSQYVYSIKNDNTLYSYTYYSCLFAPSKSNIECRTVLV